MPRHLQIHLVETEPPAPDYYVACVEGGAVFYVFEWEEERHGYESRIVQELPAGDAPGPAITDRDRLSAMLRRAIERRFGKTEVRDLSLPLPGARPAATARDAGRLAAMRRANTHLLNAYTELSAALREVRAADLPPFIADGLNEAIEGADDLRTSVLTQYQALGGQTR